MIELPHEFLNAIFAAVIIVANVRRLSDGRQAEFLQVIHRFAQHRIAGGVESRRERKVERFG